MHPPRTPALPLCAESNSIRFRVIERMILTSGLSHSPVRFEVWLVSLPKTGMYVPYGIVLPTIGGYASATSSFLKIQTLRF